MKRPTIIDIAREVGVSKAAVSYALNGRGGVSPETRDRILDVAADLGWRASSERATELADLLRSGTRPPDAISSST